MKLSSEDKHIIVEALELYKESYRQKLVNHLNDNMPNFVQEATKMKNINKLLTKFRL